ncbi:hypothetical protein DH2020_000153 [Rehmannia glutinosa]|uniref:Pentatricopeptide repeat-containing protein n=1 Tax=Rehmannia glutinosa TaxID=99300 RepID=A0ABR0XWB1_REHGL
MFTLPRNQLQQFHPNRNPIYNIFYLTLSQTHISSLTTDQRRSNSASPSNSIKPLFWFLGSREPKNAIPCRQSWVSFYCTRTYRGPIPRSLRKRINKRARAAAKPVLDEALFQKAISQLPPRFTHEELHNVIALQDDPLVCLELFNWASQQHRFRHNVLTYHVTIKKLGAAKMYEEMDVIVNQVLAIPSVSSEALYNTMIYYFTEARKLIRAVNIYKHMCGSRKLDCRPSIRTYNILFASLLREVDEAVKFLWEMAENHRLADFITYRTVLDEISRQKGTRDALRLLEELQEKNFVDGQTYKKLLHELEDNTHNLNRSRLRFSREATLSTSAGPITHTGRQDGKVMIKADFLRDITALGSLKAIHVHQGEKSLQEEYA